VSKLLGDSARAVEILGAVQNDGVMRRLEAARELGEPVLDTQAVAHPQFPRARIRSPLIVKLDARDENTFMQEWFGPISFVIAADSTGQGLALATKGAREHGALTLSVYSTREEVLAAAQDAAADAGVALSCNLTGGVYVNQSAAFSDFHGTGANPAANASLTDSAFVANRFRVVQWREHLPG
jgi:acyl-CoA reductase-like NAD-dependent aldehyde dehydrogenase